MSGRDRLAESIVGRIVSDLTGRSGLDNEWHMIDPNIRQEIVETWESIVVDVLATATSRTESLPKGES